jgi:DNA polymerase III psi subunit
VADVVVGQAQVLVVKGKPLRHRKRLLNEVLHDIGLKRDQIISFHPENGLPQGGLCFAWVAAEIGRNAAA